MDIARRLFETRGVALDLAWIEAIATAYRDAMQQLSVTVAPPSPVKPKPTRTTNGALMMLLGALENRDLWIKDCLIPVTRAEDGTVNLVGGFLTFDVGVFSAEIQYAYNLGERTMTFGRVVAIQLPHGQRLTADHPARRWLAAYRPMPELDRFSPYVQRTLDQRPAGSPAWTVVGHDSDDRLWRWPGGGEPELWKDARGREL